MEKQDKHFSDLMLEEFKRIRENDPDSSIDVWDVFISLVGKEKNHLLVMKADLPILESLVQGNSIIKTSRNLGIPSKAVRIVSALWGIEPLELTLDFNPLLVYNRGMSDVEMREKLKDIIFEDLSLEVYKTIIDNIETYLSIVDYIEEFDK
jgi:hypothetical protein